MQVVLDGRHDPGLVCTEESVHALRASRGARGRGARDRQAPGDTARATDGDARRTSAEQTEQPAT